MGPHYVYEHWRPDLNLPYYIGKGQRGRAWDMQARNAYHKRVTHKLAQDGLRPVIKLVSHHPTDAEALAHEVMRIAYWRRQGVALTNLTAGGESGIRRGMRRRRRPQLVPLVLLRQPVLAQSRVSTKRTARPGAVHLRAYLSPNQNIPR